MFEMISDLLFEQMSRENPHIQKSGNIHVKVVVILFPNLEVHSYHPTHDPVHEATIEYYREQLKYLGVCK